MITNATNVTMSYVTMIMNATNVTMSYVTMITNATNVILSQIWVNKEKEKEKKYTIYEYVQ